MFQLRSHEILIDISDRIYIKMYATPEVEYTSHLLLQQLQALKNVILLLVPIQ